MTHLQKNMDTYERAVRLFNALFEIGDSAEFSTNRIEFRDTNDEDLGGMDYRATVGWFLKELEVIGSGARDTR